MFTAGVEIRCTVVRVLRYGKGGKINNLSILGDVTVAHDPKKEIIITIFKLLQDKKIRNFNNL